MKYGKMYLDSGKTTLLRYWRSLMTILDFWDNAADGVYDKLVLGTDAPYEIGHLLVQEDRELTQVIEGYLVDGFNVVFIEIGSGTGRYMRLFGKLIFTNELYKKHLRYTIGIDFSRRMIEASARALVGSTGLRKNKELSVVAELKTKTGLTSKDILDTLSKRVHLLHADATKPFLEASNAKIVVGIMFGTLGNIPDAASVISNVKSLVHNEGIAVVTVFNNEAIDVGFKAYSELAKKGFTNLAPLRWDPKNSVFTSDLDFYSHWFSFRDFKTLIEKHFEAKAEIIPLASQGMLAKVILHGGPKVSQSPTIQYQSPILKVLCPTCGNAIGTIPMSGKNLMCTMCGHDYAVITKNHLRIPSLFPRST
jgi:SAM-dependent methyltransferase